MHIWLVHIVLYAWIHIWNHVNVRKYERWYILFILDESEKKKVCVNYNLPFSFFNYYYLFDDFK